MLTYTTRAMTYQESVKVIRMMNSLASFEETNITEDILEITFYSLDQKSYERIDNFLS